VLLIPFNAGNVNHMEKGRSLLTTLNQRQILSIINVSRCFQKRPW